MKTRKGLVLFESGAVDLNNEAHRKFISDQKNEFAAGRDFSTAEANESERGLCEQLMLVTTVLLTANVFVIGNSDLLKIMTFGQKYLALLGMVALTCSTVCGIEYYLKLKKFYNDGADAKNELVQYFGNPRFNTFGEARKKVEKTLKTLKIHIDGEWLERQIAILKCAFVIYILLVIAVFFNFGSVTRHLPVVLR